MIDLGATRIATAVIEWVTYSNDDGPDDDGWYVSVEVGGKSFDIGPDWYGPGLKTFDDAWEVLRKWAEGRGLTVTKEALSVVVPVIQQTEETHGD